MKYFLQKVITFERTIVGIHFNSKMAKTGLIANSNIRQITDEGE